MAGNYPDVPGYRMAYDRDGTVGFSVDNNFASGAVSILGSSLMVDLNNEQAASGRNIWGDIVGFIFPELRDLSGYFVAINPDLGNSATGPLQTSPDTTNGIDGVWTTRVASGNTWNQTSMVAVDARNNIKLLSVANVKGIRFLVGQGAYYALNWHAVHLYGTPSAGENVNRLRLWHPTLDQEVTGAYFDWGNVPRNTSADKQFRIKNNSPTLTASNIDVTMQAQTDTTPTVVGQHLLQKGSAPGFGASVNLTALAPGAISEVLTLRRVTPTNATLSVWTFRVVAHANSWS